MNLVLYSETIKIHSRFPPHNISANNLGEERAFVQEFNKLLKVTLTSLSNHIDRTIVKIFNERGAVLGGEIHALEYVNVKCTADKDSGIRTLVSIDRDPVIMEQIKEMQAQIAPLKEQYERARPVYERLIDYKKKQGGRPLSSKAERDLEKLRGVIHEIGEKQTELNFEVSVLESQAEVSDTAKIVIQDKAYSGTELSFFDHVKTISEPIPGGTFMLVKGEIEQVHTR